MSTTPSTRFPDSEEVRVVSSTGAAKGSKPEAFALVPAGPVEAVARALSIFSVRERVGEAVSYSELYDILQYHFWKFWGSPTEVGDSGPQNPSRHLLVAAVAGMRLISEFVDPDSPTRDDRGGPITARAFEDLAITWPDIAPGGEGARFSSLPAGALGQIARHYNAGAAKYAAHNWAAGMPWSLAFSASQRHLHAFWEGEDNDPELGSPHIVAGVWHMFTLIEFHTTHSEFDDRPVRGRAACRVPPPGA